MPTAKDVTAETSSPGDPELLTKAADSRVQPPALLPPSMLLPNGKVSIYHLVQRGLLREGSVLTYNQHYIAKVTAQGRLIPDWTRLPPNFIHPIGEQLMGDEYETPSAWATAVCKITRAQAKAQRNLSRRSTQADENSVAGPAAAPATQATPAVSSNSNDEQQGAASILTRRGSVVSRGGKMTEGRVAVNGWTACRVRLENTDPLRELGEHLLEAEGVPFDKSSRVIEVTIAYLRSHLLELLQKELRASHSASRKNSASSASTRSGHKGDGGRPSPGGGSGSSSSNSSSSSSSNSGSGEAECSAERLM